jgi:hypothetical protein
MGFIWIWPEGLFKKIGFITTSLFRWNVDMFLWSRNLVIIIHGRRKGRKEQKTALASDSRQKREE